jgi:hypothetical protein
MPRTCCNGSAEDTDLVPVAAAAAAADHASPLQVQFLLPLMQSSLMPLHETNLLRFAERLTFPLKCGLRFCC